jgi:hypothetical protein
MHPERFRTQMCKQAAACKRAVCFFAHSPDQLRHPSSCKAAAAPGAATADAVASAAAMTTGPTPGAAADARRAAGAATLTALAFSSSPSSPGAASLDPTRPSMLAPAGLLSTSPLGLPGALEQPLDAAGDCPLSAAALSSEASLALPFADLSIGSLQLLFPPAGTTEGGRALAGPVAGPTGALLSDPSGYASLAAAMESRGQQLRLPPGGLQAPLPAAKPPPWAPAAAPAATMLRRAASAAALEGALLVRAQQLLMRSQVLQGFAETAAPPPMALAGYSFDPPPGGNPAAFAGGNGLLPAASYRAGSSDGGFAAAFTSGAPFLLPSAQAGPAAAAVRAAPQLDPYRTPEAPLAGAWASGGRADGCGGGKRLPLPLEDSVAAELYRLLEQHSAGARDPCSGAPGCEGPGGTGKAR